MRCLIYGCSQRDFGGELWIRDFLKKFRDFSKILSTDVLKARGGWSRILYTFKQGFRSGIFYRVFRKFLEAQGVCSRKSLGCKKILNPKMFKNFGDFVK